VAVGLPGPNRAAPDEQEDSPAYTTLSSKIAYKGWQPTWRQ